jgi:predicted Zn-dependent peptidase
MKKIVALLILLPGLVFAQGGIDRSKAPAPGPAPKLKIGQPASFKLANGLQVYVVQNSKLPSVSVSLTLDRDPIFEGDKAGYIGMIGSLLRRGTTTMNKEKLDEEIDFLGASISASASGVSASSLKKNFAKTFALMADVALRPSMPADELEKIRKQTLSGLQAGKDDPNTISGNVVAGLVYGKNHPYGEVENENTVKNITLEDIKNYYKTYFKPNIAYLVFVGDITPAEAKALADKYFGKWAKGNVPKGNYPTVKSPAKTYIAVVDRPASVQSIITLTAPIQIKPGAPDAIAADVMNNMLGGGFSGRLFANLREKYGFTYGAYSSLSTDKLVGSFSADASVRNEKTDSAIGQFLYEFNRIRTEPVAAEEVTRMKNYLSGSFARSLENPGTIAGFALNIARYKLPATYYQDYLKNLAAVSPATVQAMANKYITPSNLHIVVVGNAKEAAKGLEKYGEVKYFDADGNAVAAPSTKAVDASITAEVIFKKAVEAMGGEAAIATIKDVEQNGTAGLMGQSFGYNQKNIVPDHFLQQITFNGMALQKRMLKGGVYTISQQGMPQGVEADDKDEMNEDAALFSEAYLPKQQGYTFTVKGIEQVDGKDAYEVAIKSPGGREVSYFYDVVSGLKVKIASAEEGPTGKVIVQTFVKEYKAFNGVQIPTKLLVDQGQLKINIDITEVKVNQGLKSEDFK